MWIIYFLMFFDWLFFGFPITDIAACVFIVYLIFKRKITIRIDFLLFLFLISLGIPTIFNILVRNLSFFEFFSLFKFSLIVLFVICSKDYFSDNITAVDVHVKRILYLSIGFSIVNLLLYYIGIHGFDFNFIRIPSAFVSETHGLRFCGIFSEPAHLGAFISFCLFYLLKRKKASILLVILASIIVLISMSFVGYILLAFVLIGHIFKNISAKKIILLVALLSIIFILFVTVPYLNTRIVNSINGDDNSSMNRLIDCWLIAFKAPFYGLGMVTLDDFVISTSIELGINRFLNVYINNGLAYVFAVGGPISLIVFVIYLFYTSKKKLYPFVFVILLFMCGTSFNTFMAWICVLFISLAMEKKTNEIFVNNYIFLNFKEDEVLLNYDNNKNTI